jgi:hypothetical protein
LRPALKQFGIEEVRDYVFREYVMSTTAKDKTIQPCSDAGGEQMSEVFYSDIDEEERSNSELMVINNNN